MGHSADNVWSFKTGGLSKQDSLYWNSFKFVDPNEIMHALMTVSLGNFQISWSVRELRLES